MEQFELPYFGKVDVDRLTEEQEYMEIDFQGRKVILMWFAEEINETYFQNAKTILDDLDTFDKNNLSLLYQEFDNSEDKTVLEYLEYHLEEMHEKFTKIIGDSSTKSEKTQKLLHALKLKAIAFHDDEIVPDYVLNQEISDQVLGIYINENLEKRIAWES
ncbi:DUF2004 domain-containing protein [Aquimarina algicola]|uniref:DUF2004 domain-containing protein n=1 Tax=Aquimarina algicola TaxID=2589995 RepID=A0A504J7L6_9FLAO|nr:DUF2004 domain-containing protein [Aquimarina algicola]TPN86817.1 DUF2004 domain-containing protein [Aquimarina algicola]